MLIMKKITLIKSVYSISTFLFSALVTAHIIVPDAPTIAAKGYILVDHHSGKVITEKQMHTKLPPASLTKIMTSYIIGRELEQGNISKEDDVIISKNAWSKNFPNSSKMFIEVGNIVKVRDLNRGIIIQSGNDACVAIAEYISGSEDSFVDLMNAWADSLGMLNTHFSNSHGLDNSDLYSTPYDIALLSSALIQDFPEVYKIYSEKKFTYNEITQYNRNSLLWDKSINIDGIKTAHTNNSGYSLVTSATQDKMRLIAVVMGTESNEIRKSESKKLLNYGFRFFETISPHQAGKVFVEERIWMGKDNTVSLGVDKNTYVTLPKGEAKNLKASFVLEKDLEAPIMKGEQVGILYYELNGNKIAEYPLLTLNEVQQAGLLSRLWDYVVLLFKDLFSLLENAKATASENTEKTGCCASHG
ncbi:D-alanyl-D-alanine carboxypeptidase [Candidatus Photodesmus katoptron]|nr:D-alanyl-D-alanine carboxypeptidase [Candidatus Photodesmus katoptron]